MGLPELAQNVDDGVLAKRDSNSDVNALIDNSTEGNKTTGRAVQYEKSGNFEQALTDFYSLQPSEIKSIKDGFLGKLEDGRSVNVRTLSSDTRPTLEIQNSNKSSIKFRYNQ
jgi:filamentous hemagglutinin